MEKSKFSPPKKAFLLSALCVLLVLANTACQSGDGTTPANAPPPQAPAAENTLDEDEIKAAASALMEEGRTVFWWYHSDRSDELGLEDAGETVESDGVEFEKVGRFQTMEELKAATQAVFTAEFCNTHFYYLINEYQKFAEIDGVLYHNSQSGGMGWVYDLPKEYIVDSVEEGRASLTAICDGLDWNRASEETVEYQFPLALVREGGGWKLDSYYDYSSRGMDIKVTLRTLKPDLADLELLTERYLYPIAFSGALLSSWTNPQQIDADSLITMYGYDRVWNADIPEEALDYEGGTPYYDVAAESVEVAVARYFRVPAAHLRQSARYDGATDRYRFDMSGVGFAYDPQVLRAEYSGDTQELTLYIDDGHGGNEKPGERAALTVYLEDTGGVKYLRNTLLAQEGGASAQ